MLNLRIWSTVRHLQFTVREFVTIFTGMMSPPIQEMCRTSPLNRRPPIASFITNLILSDLTMLCRLELSQHERQFYSGKLNWNNSYVMLNLRIWSTVRDIYSEGICDYF